MSQSLPWQGKKLTATFTDISGAAVNPGTIELNIFREWEGNTELVETKIKGDMTSPATGTWYYVFTPGDNGPGRYTARFTTDSGVDIQGSWSVSAGVEATS